MDKIPQLVVVTNSDLPTPRVHYEITTRDVLRALWRRKWLVVVMTAASLVTAIASLVYMGPSYIGEAIIQLDFAQEGAGPGAKGVSIEATALVDSTARIIRSRATAEGVVARLEMEKDPRFQHPSLKSQALSAFRSFLGFREVTPTPHDLAVNAVMAQVRVTSDPRSYVISVSATSSRPEEAATLANAVASEYFRRHTLQTMAEALAGAERELAKAALIYGVLHPNNLRARSHVEELRSRVAAMRGGTVDTDFGTLESLIPAREVNTPSGPNVPVVIAAAVVLGVAASTWLAWRSIATSRSAPTGPLVRDPSPDLTAPPPSLTHKTRHALDLVLRCGLVATVLLAMSVVTRDTARKPLSAMTAGFGARNPVKSVTAARAACLVAGAPRASDPSGSRSGVQAVARPSADAAPSVIASATSESNIPTGPAITGCDQPGPPLNQVSATVPIAPSAATIADPAPPPPTAAANPPAPLTRASSSVPLSAAAAGSIHPGPPDDAATTPAPDTAVAASRVPSPLPPSATQAGNPSAPQETEGSSSPPASAPTADPIQSGPPPNEAATTPAPDSPVAASQSAPQETDASPTGATTAGPIQPGPNEGATTPAPDGAVAAGPASPSASPATAGPVQPAPPPDQPNADISAVPNLGTVAGPVPSPPPTEAGGPSTARGTESWSAAPTRAAIAGPFHPGPPPDQLSATAPGAVTLASPARSPLPTEAGSPSTARGTESRSAPSASTASAGPVQPGLSSAPPVSSVSPAPAPAPQQLMPLPAALVASLLGHGGEMLRGGDIAAARLLYGRAAEAGNATAALAVGRTHDPRFLAQIGAHGIAPNPAAAADWYRRAAALGDHDADRLLAGLRASVAQ